MSQEFLVLLKFFIALFVFLGLVYLLLFRLFHVQSNKAQFFSSIMAGLFWLLIAFIFGISKIDQSQPMGLLDYVLAFPLILTIKLLSLLYGLKLVDNSFGIIFLLLGSILTASLFPYFVILLISKYSSIKKK